MDSNIEIITIVYADDAEDMRNAVLEELEEEADFRLVGVGTNGQEAIELVEELDPDIVLLDLEMPVLGGLEAAQHLLDSDSRAKIILYCTGVDLDTREKVKSMGVAALVEKGGNPWNFANSIRRAAAGADV
jgi:two-component system, NarL family, response regulator DesR